MELGDEGTGLFEGVLAFLSFVKYSLRVIRPQLSAVSLHPDWDYASTGCS